MKLFTTFLFLFVLPWSEALKFTPSQTAWLGCCRGGADSKKEPASQLASSSWNFVNSWFHSTSEFVYENAVKATLDAIRPTKTGPIERYEIFGVWRICLDDGEDIVFMEVRPHEIAFETKGNTVKYTFQQAKWPLSTTIEFKMKGKVYKATLRRRKLRSLKLKGEIYEEGWWWKRSAGTFAGRKMASRELKGDVAKEWGDGEETDDDDLTATTAPDDEWSGEEDQSVKPRKDRFKLKMD